MKDHWRRRREKKSETPSYLTRSICRFAFLPILLIFIGFVSPATAQPEVQLSKLDDFITHLGLGGFSCPTQMAWSNEDTILVADSCQQAILECEREGPCQKLDRSGNFEGVRGIAVDPENNLYFTTENSNRIGRCSPDGQCGSAFGSSGTGPGQFDAPREIAFDSQGRLVIAERYNHRFQICDLEGNCTAHGTPFNQLPPNPGEFGEAISVFTDKMGTILIGDFGPETVHLCDETGACSAVYGSEGAQPGEFKTPAGLGFTSRGDLVVVELSNARISVCSLEGSCRTFGTPDFPFRAPTGLLIDSQDRLYVGDQDTQQIQVFQLTYENPVLNSGFNDAWFNPQTAGQGFLISVFPDIQQMFVAWFTYDTERPPEDVEAMLGEPGHRWLTAQGPYTGNTASLTIYLTEGGVFDAPDPPAQTDSNGYGTMTIEFADCTEGLVTYEITSPNVSGEIPIQRIADDNVVLCEALAGQLR